MTEGGDRLAQAAGAALAALGVAVSVIIVGGFAAQAPAPAAGPIVRLSYRALQPGEPILVSLESDGSVKSASAAFMGRRTDLAPGPKKGTFLAFVGIDVQAKPGPAVLTVKLVKPGGPVETVRKDLLIAEKAFPSTKLSLAQKYVTPPVSAQARIKREAEIIALATSVVTPEWLGDGPFVAPNSAPSWSNFGQRRLNNNVLESLHTGLDLRVPFGGPIRAANAGRVALAADLYMGGKTVIIDHGL
ncbi:MAG TPA: M23 family metallopeptidase, partial [Acidobacteriota bacterium]|nr:M23 family metallopeptidase [Acidobacteriota bacterium]